MSININNIKYNDFKNICRTCLFNCDLKSIQQDHLIIEILHKLGVHFGTNDDLPQQICRKCFEKVNEIRAFTLKCNETYSDLVKCLNNFKKTLIKHEEVIIDNMKQETNEQIQIEEEITIDEPNIEFVPVDNYIEESNVKIKQEIIEEPNNELNEVINEINNDQNINCSEDNLLMPSTSNFKIKNNETEFPCDICNKTFNNMKALKRHNKNVHRGERPYECGDCSNSYIPLSLIKNQPCIHCGKRPFVCDVCNKTFTAAHTLKVHKRIHSGELPYQCDVCNRSFNCVGVLHNHKITHSDLRPFGCDVCGKAFKFADVLLRHKRTHSGECPYACDVCMKTFKNSSNLMRHKRIHSGERPHMCSICGKCFIDSAKLKKHTNIHEKSTTIHN